MKHKLEQYDLAQKKLSAEGFRLTQPRKEILKIFLQSKQPLKITEVFSQVQKLKIPMDRVSTYRIIEVFKNLGLIHAVGDSGFIFCSHLEEHHEKHLYLVCKKCHAVQDLTWPPALGAPLEDLILQKKFHNFDLVQVFGFCHQCK